MIILWQHWWLYVVTLALGSRPRQAGCKVAGQEGGQESPHMLLGMQRMWGNEPSHSQMNSHYGNWSLKWIPESLECDYRGQTTFLIFSNSTLTPSSFSLPTCNWTCRAFAMLLFTYKLWNLAITLVFINLVLSWNFFMGTSRISMGFFMVDNGFLNCCVVALVNICPLSFTFLGYLVKLLVLTPK